MTMPIYPLIACWILAIAPAAPVVQIDRDEEVRFYSPYAYWNGDDLVAVLRGRFVEPERGGVGRRVLVDRLISPALFRYIGKDRGEFEDSAHMRLIDRLSPFLADGESGVELRVRITGRGRSAELTLPKTGAGGQFSLATTEAGGIAVAELAAGGEQLHVEAIVPRTDPRKFSAQLRVPARTLPLVVISDLDDTVRIAEVLHRPRLIERAFLQEYEAVPGMSGVYNQLARLGAAFHFVSGSPWQLNRVIDQFLKVESFPPAVLHCRELGWDFWNADPLDTYEFKVATIAKLLQQFPTGKVLLVGDDGEHDPEVYTEISERYADRIAAVWIRHVQPEPSVERLAKVQERLGAARVVVFDTVSQLDEALRAVKVDVYPH